MLLPRPLAATRAALLALALVAPAASAAGDEAKPRLSAETFAGLELRNLGPALKSMGIDHFEVLVMPRLIGLVIALPLLTIIADAMGLAGGALLSSLLLDISLTQFIPRVQAALAPTTFWAGLIKAPVFALLIAMVGTYRGMQVRDSSRELGRLTTVAVVQSIFLVIFADAVFAVVYVQLDF